MKTFLFDTIDRFKRFSKELDVKTVLCQKAWFVLNEDGNKEVLIFQPDGKVIASVNGNASIYTWQYIPQNNSVMINHTDLQGTMLKPAFYNEEILAFQKDGTKECMFMLDDNSPIAQKVLSLEDVKTQLLSLEGGDEDNPSALETIEEQLVQENFEALQNEEEERKYWDSIIFLCDRHEDELKELKEKYNNESSMSIALAFIFALCLLFLGTCSLCFLEEKRLLSCALILSGFLLLIILIAYIIPSKSENKRKRRNRDIKSIPEGESDFDEALKKYPDMYEDIWKHMNEIEV